MKKSWFDGLARGRRNGNKKATRLDRFAFLPRSPKEPGGSKKRRCNSSDEKDYITKKEE